MGTNLLYCVAKLKNSTGMMPTSCYTAMTLDTVNDITSFPLTDFNRLGCPSKLDAARLNSLWS